MLKMCIAIFFARICDVSIGSIKTVYIVKGKSFLSSFLAFLEILIWYKVAKTALNGEITSFWIPISYAAGYAFGTLLGTYISNIFINSEMCLMVIIKENKKLIEVLRENGFAVSICNLTNNYDNIKKNLLFIKTNKKSLNKVKDYILKYDKKAFIVVNELKYSHNGVNK